MLHREFGLVSIIMAAYNAEKTIELAIESVLNQTYSNFELLVINDCSKDGTAKLVEAFSAKDNRVRLISNEKNSGVSFTRKHGLEESNGSWIAILDSDDAWAPDKLEKQIKLQKRTNADLLFTGSAFMDSDGQPIDWYLHAPAEVTYRQLLKQNVLSNSSALVRKELYAKHYAIGDRMHEDFAIWLSILKEGKKAYAFPNLIHSSAYVSPYAKMGWGCVLLNNSVVQNGSTVGNGVLLNPGVEVHHDCSVDDFALIYTNSVVRTYAKVGKRVRIGSNCTICNNATVSDGADIPDCTAVH